METRQRNFNKCFENYHLNQKIILLIIHCFNIDTESAFIEQTLNIQIDAKRLSILIFAPPAVQRKTNFFPLCRCFEIRFFFVRLESDL